MRRHLVVTLVLTLLWVVVVDADLVRSRSSLKSALRGTSGESLAASLRAGDAPAATEASSSSASAASASSSTSSSAGAAAVADVNPWEMTEEEKLKKAEETKEEPPPKIGVDHVPELPKPNIKGFDPVFGVIKHEKKKAVIEPKKTNPLLHAAPRMWRRELSIENTAGGCYASVDACKALCRPSEAADTGDLSGSKGWAMSCEKIETHFCCRPTRCTPPGKYDKDSGFVCKSVAGPFEQKYESCCDPEGVNSSCLENEVDGCTIWNGGLGPEVKK